MARPPAPTAAASTDEPDAAAASMGRHVAPGGVLIVEPWYFTALP